MADRARLNESHILIANLGGQGGSLAQRSGKNFGHITNPLQYNTVNLFKMES